jgi:O-antigen/teichoic acid export membrane protein
LSETAEAPASSAGTIGKEAGRGLRWGIFGNLVAKAGSFAVGLVLARLLAPSEFGVYAIAFAASQFLIHVNDVGIFAATVQWRGKLEDMTATATVMAFLFSSVIYGLFWLVTPLYTAGTGSAEATPIVRLLTLIILIDGVTTVRAAILVRTFQQDKLIKANLAGFVVQAVVSITLAVGGAGAYSFTWGQLAANTTTGVLVLAFARMPLRLALDREVFIRLLKFGAPLAVSLGIEAVLLNSDKTIIGDAVGAAMLGYYALAFNVSSWVPGLLGSAVRYVSLPSFSRLAEEDSDALTVGVQRSIPLLIAVVLPVALTMALLAPALVAFLYGGKWGPAAPVLSILAVVMVVRMIAPVVFDILTSLGHTRSTVWLNLGWCAALVPGLLIGVHLDGIRGAAIAQALAGILVALPLAVAMLARAGIRLIPVWPALVRPLIGAAAAAAVMLPLARMTAGIPIVELCTAGGAGLLIYVLVVVPRDRLRQLAARLTSRSLAKET